MILFKNIVLKDSQQKPFNSMLIGACLKMAHGCPKMADLCPKFANLCPKMADLC